MRQYLELVSDVLENGRPAAEAFRSDRTGVGTYSVFGRQLRVNLNDGFPLLTTKKMHLKWHFGVLEDWVSLFKT
jgi:thymidylate synthase